MNKSVLLIFGLAGWGLQAAYSEETPAAAEKKPSVYTVQNKSSFTQGEAKRNPFMPIGFKKDEIVKPVELPPDITPAAFSVSSIILGTPNIAVINGKDVAQGEWFNVQVGGGTLAKTEKVYLLQVLDGVIVVYHPKLKQPLRVQVK